MKGPMTLVLICGSVACVSLVQWDASGLQDYAVYEAPSLQESLYCRFLCSHEVVSSMTSCISCVSGVNSTSEFFYLRLEASKHKPFSGPKT